jgi:hypothetical protein
MSQATCAAIRELIPDWAGERLDPATIVEVEAHVAACAECGDELALARSIFASRATIPAGLADRVSTLVSRDDRSIRRPWWGLSAAAVAALAIGIGIASEPSGSDFSTSAPGYASGTEEGELWLSDDGLIAGAPTLEVLSDQALLDLLDELAMGTGGGAI